MIKEHYKRLKEIHPNITELIISDINIGIRYKNHSEILYITYFQTDKETHNILKDIWNICFNDPVFIE